MNKIRTVGIGAAFAALGYGAMNTDFNELLNKAEIAKNSTEERIRNKVADGFIVQGTPEDYKHLKTVYTDLSELANRTPAFKEVFDKVGKNPSFSTMQRLSHTPSSDVYLAYVKVYGDEVCIEFGRNYGTKAYLKKAQEEYNQDLKKLIDEIKKEFNLE